MPQNLDLVSDVILGQTLTQDALVLTANYGGGNSPVDFDITIGIYLVLFLLTWFLLKKLLIEPYLEVRERRAQGTSGSRDEAAAMKREADDVLTEYEQRLEKAKQEASALRSDLREEGTSEQKAILELAYAEASKDLAKRREALNAQVEGARGELKREAKALSELIVDRLLPGT